jgi:hypothetical protein
MVAVVLAAATVLTALVPTPAQIAATAVVAATEVAVVVTTAGATATMAAAATGGSAGAEVVAVAATRPTGKRNRLDDNSALALGAAVATSMVAWAGVVAAVVVVAVAAVAAVAVAVVAQAGGTGACTQALHRSSHSMDTLLWRHMAHPPVGGVSATATSWTASLSAAVPAIVASTVAVAAAVAAVAAAVEVAAAAAVPSALWLRCPCCRRTRPGPGRPAASLSRSTMSSATASMPVWASTLRRPLVGSTPTQQQLSAAGRSVSRASWRR